MSMSPNSALDVAAAHSIFAAQRLTRHHAPQSRNGYRAIQNERIKLGSGFLNAIGLTLIAFALLRPVTQDLSELTPISFLWVGLGIALHGGAHVMLGRLYEEDARERD